MASKLGIRLLDVDKLILYYIQGRFLLYVAIVDDDSIVFTSSDPVEDIFVELELATSNVFTTPMEYTGDSGNARLELSFRVQCGPGFTGSNCTSK